MFDPVAERYHGELTATLEDTIRGADAVVLMVGHDAFGVLDPSAVGALVRKRLLIDTRAFLPAQRWAAAGFDVYTLGGKRRDPLRLVTAS